MHFVHPCNLCDAVIGHYGNEYYRKHREKQKSRQLFSSVMGHYSSEYNENAHGAP